MEDKKGCYQKELVSDKDYLCHCWISASRAAQVSYLTVISLIWGAEESRNENEGRKLSKEAKNRDCWRLVISEHISLTLSLMQLQYICSTVENNVWARCKRICIYCLTEE